ncbi:ribosome recycling factor, partial [Piedraia hortae CBS 480.64]
FSQLESDVLRVINPLKKELSELRPGGRFNTAALEKLPTCVDKRASKTVRLGDVAQLVPRGRTVQVLVGEQQHVKPVSAAIQSSNLSLSPQPDPTGTNPLLLVLTIPPPTAESRKAALNQATDAGQKAEQGVRNARAQQQKKMRELEKIARPDEWKKSHDKMEKMVKAWVQEVKELVDKARKTLQS